MNTERIMIKDLPQKVGEEVVIKGWVDVVRNQGKMAFFDFRDRSGKVQGVVFGKPEVLEVAKTLRNEWVVEITGKVQERNDKTAKAAIEKEVETGVKEFFVTSVELEITDMKIISKSEIPFELNEKVNLDTYLDNLPYTLRSDSGVRVFKIQADIIKAFREELEKVDFIEYQNPAITGGDAEGGAGVFKLDYFNKDAFLATSPQLYKQIMVGVFERVYTTPKIFRAEKHSTSWHLNEITQMDFEFAFIKDHTDIMNILEKVIKNIIKKVSEKHMETLKIFNQELPLVPEKIPVMKLKDALALINKETGEKCLNEPDLERSHEDFLCKYAKKNFNSDFIFITHYPVKKRPFYTYEDENDLGYTKSFDLLFKGVEINTGGQRINELGKLVENIEKWGMKKEDFSFYLQAFETGMPTMGGCSTGLERLTAKFLGLTNVRQATLFPRDMNRIDKLIGR